MLLKTGTKHFIHQVLIYKVRWRDRNTAVKGKKIWNERGRDAERERNGVEGREDGL